MASPLGLTDFSKLVYTSDNGNTNDANFTGSYNSIFNGSKFYYRPTIASETVDVPAITDGENTQDNRKASTKKVTNARSSKMHQEADMYDISTNSIIQYTNDPALPAITLKQADFAYLRDLGVYPNNRLITCRRFPSPTENDLTAVGMAPISTVLSWITDESDSFFSFKSSEEWQIKNTKDPLGDLTDIFNKIFAKATGINAGGEMGGMISGVGNLFPIGGIKEALQTTVTNYLLGSEDTPGTNFSYDNLPMGNPNFMGQSLYRDMNSITSDISIPIKTVYELKFMRGIDPTIVFMDVLQNLLRFSSSQSVFYISQTGGGKINEFFNKFKDGHWIDAIGIILDGIIEAVKKLANDIGSMLETGKKVIKDVVDGDLSISQETKNAVKDQLLSGLKKISSSALSKYRIEFAKIIPASTGASSAPWHITIGNPKNPFFSSGDMVASGCEVKFGNTLGFNDLPTRIEFNFTIKSARHLGIQEIFDKFNIGAGRQYQRNSIVFKTDFYQGSVSNTKGDDSTNPVTGAASGVPSIAPVTNLPPASSVSPPVTPLRVPSSPTPWVVPTPPTGLPTGFPGV